MTITLTWDLVFLWVGRIACSLMCLIPLGYFIGFIWFSISMSGWTFRESWLGRKLRGNKKRSY